MADLNEETPELTENEQEQTPDEQAKPGRGATPGFRPIRIKGKPLSVTIMRERR